MLNNNQNTNQFYEDLWQNDWADMEEYNPTARHLKKMIVAIISKLDNIETIIDAGCGMGLNLIHLQQNFPHISLTGGELSEPIIKIARNYIKNSQNINLKTLDLSDKNLNHEIKYDLVLCNQVLEHVENDIQAIANLSKLSKKYILLTVPAGKYNKTSEIVGHYRHYSKNELIEKIENQGIKVLEVYNWGFPFHSIYKFILNILSKEHQKKIGMGKYGPIKILISNFLYHIYKLNSYKYGENIILLGQIIKKT